MESIAFKFAVDSLITKIIIPIGQKLWKSGKDYNKKHDPFGTVATQYIHKVHQRFNLIRIFGMAEPVALTLLFVRVNILEKISIHEHLKGEEADKYVDIKARSFGKKRATKDGIALYNGLQKFIVLGKPGAGKSTYLKYLALMSINEDSGIEDKKLPIFIELKQLEDSGLSLMEFIRKQFEISHLSDHELFIEKLLFSGKCLILLDGFDEVKDGRKKSLITEINDFSDRYSQNDYVISCRIAVYNQYFQHFTDVEIADFNDEQIDDFVGKWFTAQPKIGQDCLSKLQNPDNKAIKELASTPLLLTMLCIAFGQALDFSPSRAEIYHDALDALLQKWDSSRNIKREEFYKGMSRGKKEKLFSHIAYHAFREGQYLFKPKELIKTIGEYIKGLPNIDLDDLDNIAKGTLLAIETHHGILIQRVKNWYSFSHLTFQEYYTARYIVHNPNKAPLSAVIEQYATHESWKEVFLLIGEMLDDATEYLIMLRDHSHSLVQNQTKIIELLRGLDSIIRKDGAYSRLASKSVALVYTIAIAIGLIIRS